MGLDLPQLVPRMDTSDERFLLLVVYPLCLLPILLLLRAARKHHRQRVQTATRGCRKLGLKGYSNVRDEYDPKYSKASPPSSGAWRIKALFIHPVKSCPPIELDSADLCSTGLAWDRQFSFAEYAVPMKFPRGTPLSEKKLPRWTFRSLRQPGYENLVHIRCEVWVPDPEYVRANRIRNPNVNGVLVMRYPKVPHGTRLNRWLLQKGQSLNLVPRQSCFRVPLLPPKNHTYPVETFSIWSDLPQALNYGRHVPPDLKAFLGIPDRRPFTLFRALPASYRQVSAKRGSGAVEVPYQPVVAFPDSYPVHLLNLASVHDVAARVKQNIPSLSARRFRPNILVTGPDAYDEDDWKRVRFHPRAFSGPSARPLDFHTACHALRCRLPNVDPDTGVRHDTEPDKTLRSFRCIDGGDRKLAALGLQLVLATPAEGGEMKLREGDRIEVLERGELVIDKA